jgi:hypothetical protein
MYGLCVEGRYFYRNLCQRGRRVLVSLLHLDMDDDHAIAISFDNYTKIMTRYAIHAHIQR